MALAMLVGFVLGLLGAIPIAGPIAVLVIYHGVEGSPRSAFLIAAGSAVAEGVYAALAFLGLGALIADHAWLDPAARGVGAGVLGGLSYVLWRRSAEGGSLPAQQQTAVPAVGPTTPVASFGLGFTIAATNPAMVLTWMSAVAVVQAAGWLVPGALNSLAFALGTTAGILAWSSFLVVVVARLRDRAGPGLLLRIQRGASLFVGALALMCLWRFAAYFLV